MWLAKKMLRSSKAASGRMGKRIKGEGNHSSLPSNVHDVERRKGHRRKRVSKATIATTVVIGLFALGTLFFVAERVRTQGQFFLNTGDGRVLVGVGQKDISSPHSSGPTLEEQFMKQRNRILPPDSIYRVNAKDIHGTMQHLMQYAGYVSLIVNVACE